LQLPRIEVAEDRLRCCRKGEVPKSWRVGNATSGLTIHSRQTVINIKI
jgi:hypothetical protein